MKYNRMDHEHLKTLHIHGITIEPVKWTVSVDGQPIFFTSQQFRIMHLLMRNAGRFFTRRQILDHVQAGSKVTEHLVDAQVSAIRKKLGSYGHVIQTKRGIGYGIRI